MASDSLQLDITDPEAIAKAVTEFAPDAIVNAAAYTAVDKAESEPELAKAINSDGPSYLASAAALLNIPFVHVSTDYVFDGCASEPYSEATPCSPKNVYGKTKLDGEVAALKANPKTIVIRTAWVFSEYGNNFVKTMLRVGTQRDELGVVDDQFGSPTYAGDIADTIIAMLQSPGAYGVYHFAAIRPFPGATLHGKYLRLLMRLLFIRTGSQSSLLPHKNTRHLHSGQLTQF